MTILGNWGWKIERPRNKFQAVTYFPKAAVAVVADANLLTPSFWELVAGLQRDIGQRREEIRFLIWDQKECDQLVAAFKSCQKAFAKWSWTSLDFTSELPVEWISLQFYNVDNLQFFHRSAGTGLTAYTPKLEPEQITDLPETGARKPKVFFYGSEKHMPAIVATFFGKQRRHPEFRTYGYGSDPELYDHWFSADYQAELIVRNRTETEYCFDMVVTTIVCDFVGFLDSVIRDQKKDIDWADSKLRPGGLFVLYAKASNLKHHLGTLVNRFTDFSVTYPAAGIVVVMCVKKHERSRDDAAREVLEECLSYPDNQWEYPSASLINAGKERIYTVSADPDLDPVIFTRWMGEDYVQRFCNGYPFRPLRKIFKRAQEAEPTRLVTTPSVTQLTKLRLRGIIQGKDGEVVVTKQTDETVTTETIEKDYDENGEEKAIRRIVRTRKRVRQISLVLRDPKTNLDTNPLRKGDAIVVDAA